MLRDRDLLWHHCRRSDACDGPAGMPDLVIIGRSRILWRELKGDDGRVTTAQLDFGDAICRAGGSWSVWHPVDLSTGRIEREMEALG